MTEPGSQATMKQSSVAATPSVRGTGTPPLTSKPTAMNCPHCGASIQTKVTYKSGILTWLICCLTGCCCIFCINAAKDARHECPSCGKVIGDYKRI